MLTKGEAMSKKDEPQSNDRKEEETFQVILTKMNHTTKQDKLSCVLASLGHKVVKISVIKNAKDEPLPLFLVELERRENNNDIFNVKKLWDMAVEFEPVHKKNTLIKDLEGTDPDYHSDEMMWALNLPRETRQEYQFLKRYASAVSSGESTSSPYGFSTTGTYFPEPSSSSTDSSAPRGSSTSRDGSGPTADSDTKDISAPRDSSAPRDNSVPRGGSAERGCLTPEDNSAPRDSSAPSYSFAVRGSSAPRAKLQCQTFSSDATSSTFPTPLNLFQEPNQFSIPACHEPQCPGCNPTSSENHSDPNEGLGFKSPLEFTVLPNSPHMGHNNPATVIGMIPGALTTSSPQPTLIFSDEYPQPVDPEPFDLITRPRTSFGFEIMSMLSQLASEISVLENNFDNLEYSLGVLLHRLREIGPQGPQPGSISSSTTEARNSNSAEPTPFTPSVTAEQTTSTTSVTEEQTTSTTSVTEEETTSTTSVTTEQITSTTSVTEEETTSTTSVTEEQTTSTTSVTEEQTTSTTSVTEEETTSTTSVTEEQTTSTTSVTEEETTSTTSVTTEQITSTPSNAAEQTPSTPSNVVETTPTTISNAPESSTSDTKGNAGKE